MQDHPVPQNVTAYEFHLIGNMTLKQFLELAGGGVLAFLTYSSNLPDLLKWPLVAVFVILGIALAFLPIEERPLDNWIISFLRAIYNPTKFHWEKMGKVPEVFDYVAGTKREVGPSVTPPQRSERVNAYFQSIAGSKQGREEGEEFAMRAFALTQMYDSVPAAKDVSASGQIQQLPEKPNIAVRVRQLHAKAQGGPSGTILIRPIARKQKEVRAVSLPTAVASQNLVGKAPVQVQDAGREPLAIEQRNMIEEAKPTKSAASQGYISDQAALQNNPQGTLTEVQKSKNLPFPKTPTEKNVVVGMVLDKAGKILENAIVEIRKPDGFPVRALKSNRLGQFFASTPLPAGQYEVVVEKEGFTFPTQTLTLENSVVQPLQILSTNALN